MEILQKKYYNQSVGKYKLLSTAAGVGSIIPTKMGGFIMPLSSYSWSFVQALTQELQNYVNRMRDLDYADIQDATGTLVIEDHRFVNYLATTEGLQNLRCFVEIPHVDIDEYGKIDFKNHPLYKRLQARLRNLPTEDKFYIPFVDFPQWFINSKSSLRPIKAWRDQWVRSGCNDGNLDYFAPPRDPEGASKRKQRNDRLGDRAIYKLLRPVPLILICPNGHIADVPWDRFFNAHINHCNLDRNEGFDLFGYPAGTCPMGGYHDIKWISNRNQSESWGVLKCSKCEQVVSLSGVMNIKPFCNCGRPWDESVPYDASCNTPNGQSTLMQVAMVTSNAVYYANSFRSLYIPSDLLFLHEGELSDEASKALTKIENIYNKRKDAEQDKQHFWSSKTYLGSARGLIEFADENWEITLEEDDYEPIKNKFLGLADEAIAVDPETEYRLSEYEVLCAPEYAHCKSQKLEINEVVLPEQFVPYFQTVRQIPTLALTTTQLGFGRVKMPTPTIVNGNVVQPKVQPIYSGNPSDVWVLPANQVFGEGLFFSFREEKLSEWEALLKEKDVDYNCEIRPDEPGAFLAGKMQMYSSAKFYMLHSFAHALIKELEFSCGYPSASISERIYYSDKMCGVLIYTADGSEGSMGGLVWQGQTNLLETILKKALQRATQCASDPICWNHEDGLNKAACFSCSMVSETSCEFGNMGLDRLALVDPEFGFFRDIL